MRRPTLLVFLLLTACGDDLNGEDIPADAASREIAIQFAPKVGARPFACGQTYAALGEESTAITPRDFRVYLHDVTLLGAGGSAVPLALAQDGAWQHDNVALLDFEDFTGDCADGTPETNTVVRGTAPDAEYVGVAFTLGVPAALNHVDLTTLPAPLNVTGLWWGWGFGHVFLAVVSHAQLADGVNDHYVHIGSIGCAGDPEIGEPVTCSKPNRAAIELRGFDPTRQPITADFAAVLTRSKLATSAGCHSFTEETCGFPFDFIGLNWFTGSQTPSTQTLFRVDP